MHSTNLSTFEQVRNLARLVATLRTSEASIVDQLTEKHPRQARWGRVARRDPSGQRGDRTCLARRGRLVREAQRARPGTLARRARPALEAHGATRGLRATWARMATPARWVLRERAVLQARGATVDRAETRETTGSAGPGDRGVPEGLWACQASPGRSLSGATKRHGPDPLFTRPPKLIPGSAGKSGRCWRRWPERGGRSLGWARFRMG
ncbi:hypothetical protein T484DRAFT_2270969 [Baffinella frigidus]|nr:hypothetical protein T484DRAFT_2270969 [Cryptophyta sp. CCMP2293]